LVAGVDRAFIFGSWAARYSGEPGPPPHDVDVLVVGTADLDDLDEIAHTAEARLDREVNIRRIRPQTWEQPPANDAFLASLRSRPLTELDLARAESFMRWDQGRADVERMTADNHLQRWRS
jgi:hypothetical protein